MNPFLVISCAISLNNCQSAGAPGHFYAGQPIVLDFNTLPDCQALAKKGDESNEAKHLNKRPLHSVCVEIEVNTTGGFDAADVDGGASLWVPVIASSDAAASAADGPPSGLIPPLAFTNNAQCLAALPKVEPGKMYPVCAKVEVFGNRKLLK